MEDESPDDTLSVSSTGESSVSDELPSPRRGGDQYAFGSKERQDLMTKSREMIRKLTEDLTAERLHSEQKQDELSAVSAELSDQRSEVNELKRQVEMLLDKEYLYQQTLDNLQINDEGMQAQMAGLSQELEAKDKEMEVLREGEVRRNELELTLEAKTEEVNRLNEKCAGQDLALEEVTARLNGQMHTLQGTLDATKQALRDAETKCAAMTETSNLSSNEIRARLEAHLEERASLQAVNSRLVTENQNLTQAVRMNTDRLFANFEATQTQWTEEIKNPLSALDKRLVRLKQQERHSSRI